MAHFIQIATVVAVLAGWVTAIPPGQTICNAAPYGKPNHLKCFSLLQTFAYGQDDALRIFDEEQLREDEGRSWSGIVNPFKPRVVQLPRSWTNGTSKVVFADFIAVTHC